MNLPSRLSAVLSAPAAPQATILYRCHSSLNSPLDMSSFAPDTASAGAPSSSSSAADADTHPDPSSIAFKLAKAEGYKAEGNAHFKAGLFKKALLSYSKVLAYAKCLPGSKRGGENSMTEMAMNASKSAPSHTLVTAEQDLAAKGIEGVVETNISVCHIKLGNGSKALEHANKALALLGDSAFKPLLRKAEALVLLQDFDRAKDLLDKAAAATEDAAQTASCAAARRTLAAAQRVADKKDREAYKNIFKA